MRKTFVIIMRPGIHTRPLYYQMLMKLCLVGDLLRSLLVAEILDLLVQLHHSHEDDDDNVEDKRDNAGQEKPEIDDRNGVDTAWQKMLADGNGAWIQLEEVPQGKDLYLSGVNVTPLTGEGAGQTFLLDKIEGDCITIGMCFGMSDLNAALSKVKPGDEIILDNSDYIAIQSYYRHQVPEDLSFHAWDQFRDENGKPALPQRKSVLGYFFTGTGTVQDGNIQGKTIVVQSLMDESTCPWCADWYRKKVAETKGGEQDFRVYYMDRCMHGDVTFMENNMVTNYLGAHRQSLLDLAAWVEKGIEPLPSSVYEYRDGQIIPAATDFGFEDNRNLPGGIDADYPVKGSVTRFSEDGVSAGSSTVTYTFDEPGVYYAAVRVKANRNGDEKDLFTQVKNISRAKVIVE